MTDKAEKRDYLILNIDTRVDKVFIQVNKKTDTDMCYNLTFAKSNREYYLVCQGFFVPCYSGRHESSIYGDVNTRTIVHCLKVLPKILYNKINLVEVIADIIKREKLNLYQINVNSNMDYSQAKKINILTLSTIQTELNNQGFPIAF
jgi:hypothetical protein